MLTASGHTQNALLARSRLAWTTAIGFSLFVILYVIAALLYPGGSNADSTEPGFNIYTNYWCDLLGNTAKNGQPNPGQSVAFTAMGLLCLTLAYFWYVTPVAFAFPKRAQRLLQTAGVLSMSIAPFIFTTYHDAIINIAGVFGSVAMLGTLVGVYKNHAFALFLFGIICLVLCGLNNYIYHTHQFIDQLPIIQKITFLLFLLWFVLVPLTLRRNATTHA